MTMSDIDRPSTWVPFKSDKMCGDCRAGCCHLPVEVRLPDLERMELVSPGSELVPAKKLAADLAKRGIIQNYRDRTGIYTLAQKSDRSCIFLDANARCKIYDRRPDTCRNFPRVGPRSGWCPYRKK
jgi:Fe-S-cluster containining protein